MSGARWTRRRPPARAVDPQGEVGGLHAADDPATARGPGPGGLLDVSCIDRLNVNDG